MPNDRLPAAVTPGNPRWRDARNERAGRYVERMGLRKVLARANDLTPQRISQIRNGCPTGAPQRWFEWLENAARHPRLDPWPPLIGSIGLVLEVTAEEVPNPWPTLHETMDDEAERQAEEDVAWHRFLQALREGDPERIREALDRFIVAAELEMDRQARAVGLARVLRRGMA